MLKIYGILDKKVFIPWRFNVMKKEKVELIEEIPAELKYRADKLLKEFAFAGYKWTTVTDENVDIHSKTSRITYDLKTLERNSKVDLLSPTSIMNKRNTYRQYLEAMFSLMYDAVILDIKVQLTGATTFKVTFYYVNGQKFFDTSCKIFSRPVRPSAQPLITTMQNYRGTVFPLLACIQLACGQSMNKGALACKYVYDESGDPVSIHYNKDSFDKGIPIMSMMLTMDEYKELKKYTSMVDKYVVLTDYLLVSRVLGSGDSTIGSFLLWLSILIDEHAGLEHWTFNMAYDTDNTITCARRFRLMIPQHREKYNTRLLMVNVSSHVIGIMAEGLEAILNMEPSNLKSKNEAEYTVEFCNGIENESAHSQILDNMERIIFEDLFNDTCTFGWKLGNDEGEPYVGLLCVPLASNHKEVRGPDFVRRAKFTVKYKSFFFCPDKTFAWLFKLKGFHKKSFGGRITLDRLMYPIDVTDDVIIFKSYSKTKENKYRYVTLISLKEYDRSTGPFGFFSRLFADKYELDHQDPFKDPFTYSLLTSRVKKFCDLEKDKMTYTFVGSRLIVLENASYDE